MTDLESRLHQAIELAKGLSGGPPGMQLIGEPIESALRAAVEEIKNLRHDVDHERGGHQSAVDAWNKEVSALNEEIRELRADRERLVDAAIDRDIWRSRAIGLATNKTVAAWSAADAARAQAGGGGDGKGR